MTISPFSSGQRAPVRGEAPSPRGDASSPAIAHRVIATAPPPTRSQARRDWPRVDLKEPAAEQRVLAWLDEADLPSQLPPGFGRAGVSARVALQMVRSSGRRLPAAQASRLGLADGATLGEAATALTRAVDDPDGPRCRSYRAAAYYLHDLHDLQAVFDDL